LPLAVVVQSRTDALIVFGPAGLLAIACLVRFLVYRLRSGPAERARWQYHGRHDGYGGFSPPRPDSPDNRRRYSRLSGLLVIAAVALVLGIALDQLDRTLGIILIAVAGLACVILQLMMAQAGGAWSRRKSRHRDGQ
jgi:hypothetical protein